MHSQTSRSSTVGVDVLRGAAILMVVAYHAFGGTWGWLVPWSDGFRDFSASTNSVLKWFYPVTCGWIGVPLFFVLSGFCIHYSYLRSGRFNGGAFFWRRFWRIYPAYFIALLVFTLVIPYGIPFKALRHQFVTHALFIHNGSFNQFFGINGSFWSIAVEVQLYLLFPLMLLVRGRFGMLKTVALLFVVGCLWRVGVLCLLPLPDHVINPAWTCPLMCWFDWALGALVAERFVTGERMFQRPAVWATLFAALFAASTFVQPLTVFSFTLASAAAAVVLEAALHMEWRPRVSTRFLAFIGTISYSLYLWHQPLIAPIVAAGTWLTGSPYVAWLSLGPALVAVAWLSYVAIERPGIAAGRLLWSAIFSRAEHRQAAVHGPALSSSDSAQDDTPPSKRIAA